VQIGGISIRNRKIVGIDEGYSTWLWPNRKGDILYPNHPLGEEHGKFKYCTLNWYANSNDLEETQKFASDDIDVLKTIKPTRFANSRHCRSISNSTILYCDRGEFLVRYGSDVYYNNYGSHKKGSQGGTNVLFGDFPDKHIYLNVNLYQRKKATGYNQSSRMVFRRYNYSELRFLYLPSTGQGLFLLLSCNSAVKFGLFLAVFQHGGWKVTVKIKSDKEFHKRNL